MTVMAPQAGRCAGTHAVAGPIPADSLGYPTPDVSAGPRPAEHRPAIPTRVYEAGSGARHHPAPAHRPHPPRPPPSRGGPLAGPGAVAPRMGPASSRLRGQARPGRGEHEISLSGRSATARGRGVSQPPVGVEQETLNGRVHERVEQARPG